MRILGIDLGSSSLKAVEMDSAFGRYDIHDYHEVPVGPGISLTDVVANLLKTLSKAPDKVIVALPSKQTTFRTLQFPIRDKKAIQSSVTFELEDELPFSLEDSAFDFSILTQTKQGSTVHVATTLKRYLSTNIDLWEETSLEPEVITTEGWALRVLFNKLIPASRQSIPVAYIHIGNSQTLFYLHWQNNPLLMLSIPFGGKDITEALATQFGMSMEDAERKKLEQGMILTNELKPDMKSEPFQVSECLIQSLTPILEEFRQLEVMSRSATHEGIGEVFIGGGTSLLPGLASWLQGKLNISVKTVPALSGITSSGVTYSEETEARFALATALSLSLVGPERALCVNFRKGAFIKQGKARHINFSALRRPLIALGIVTTCLFLSLIVQSSVYRSRLNSTNDSLKRGITDFLGNVTGKEMARYLSNTASLRSAVNKELNKYRELSKLFGPNPYSPLDFLNGQSKTIPRDVVVDLIQFQQGQAPAEPFSSNLQNSNYSMTYLIANPQIAERLASILSGRYSGVQRGKMEEVSGPDPTTKKWKITFTGKPNEDSYAN